MSFYTNVENPFQRSNTFCVFFEVRGAMPRQQQNEVLGTMPRQQQNEVLGAMPRHKNIEVHVTMPRRTNIEVLGTTPRQQQQNEVLGAMPIFATNNTVADAKITESRMIKAMNPNRLLNDDFHTRGAFACAA